MPDMLKKVARAVMDVQPWTPFTIARAALSANQFADYKMRAHAQIAQGTSKENVELDNSILDENSATPPPAPDPTAIVEAVLDRNALMNVVNLPFTKQAKILRELGVM